MFCDRKCDCLGIAGFVGVIIGILTAFLRITAEITVPSVFLWVAFGIGVGFIGLELLGIALSRKRTDCECIENALNVSLISALGTVLFSLILLAVEFAIASVVGAIITGLLFLSFSLLLISTVCLIRCLAKIEK